jgi:hypothetical protein
MKKNVGSIDKVIRILMALLVITLYFTQVISGTVAVILLIVSAILILTSVISFCPIYWPFGISTDKKKV